MEFIHCELDSNTKIIKYFNVVTDDITKEIKSKILNKEVDLNAKQ